MSVSASSRTKSATRSTTSDSVSIDSPEVDRWTHNICYRELVASTCVGIVQLWWHPYIQDLSKLLPFLFVYNVFSVVVGYPMFYLELALGVVTKKSVLNCWDLAPMFRGIGISMLITAAFTALATGALAAWCLAMFVHSFHVFLPWLHCAATATPACAARHRPMPPGSETPAQSFFFNYVLRLKRDGVESGLGTIVKELAVYYVICWILIYCIAFKRIYSISKLVMFKDVLAYFVLICAGVGCVRLDGAGLMVRKAEWSVIFSECRIWRDAAEFALIQMAVSQGTLIMLGNHCPRQQHSLARTSLVAFAASKTTCMLTALTLGAANGALTKDYETYSNIHNGSSASVVLWADYVARIPGNQFWSAIIFFTLFVLALTSTALTVHTLMSSFTGHSIRKIAWAFLVLICVLFGLIGLLSLCSQGGLYIVNFVMIRPVLKPRVVTAGLLSLVVTNAYGQNVLTNKHDETIRGGLYIVNFVMSWPVLKPRVVTAGLLSLVVTYAYGQTVFCEDVYFAVGEYPNVFLRVCWALSPGVLLFVFLCGLSTWPAVYSTAGWALLSLALAPVLLVSCVYLVFKFRVRNIVDTEK